MLSSPPSLPPSSCAQELEDLRAGNKLLKEEVGQLTADRSSLQIQADGRSSHCMTLISENKRLLAAVRNAIGRPPRRAASKAATARHQHTACLPFTASDAHCEPDACWPSCASTQQPMMHTHLLMRELDAQVNELRVQNSTLRDELAASKADLTFAQQHAAKARRPLVAANQPQGSAAAGKGGSRSGSGGGSAGGWQNAPPGGAGQAQVSSEQWAAVGHACMRRGPIIDGVWCVCSQRWQASCMGQGARLRPM